MTFTTTTVNGASLVREAQAARDFYRVITTIEHSEIAVADLSAEALSTVLSGVITGEGPTTGGRVHFSRTLDTQDAALCERIVISAGGAAGAPVTRREADMLFDIDAAASERTDNGRFNDLFVKSIAHCVLSEAGRRVPPRQVALVPATPVASWASTCRDVDSEILAWIASHVGKRRPVRTSLMTLTAVLAGMGVALSDAASPIAALTDLMM